MLAFSFFFFFFFFQRLKGDIADRNALLQRLNSELHLGKYLHQGPLSQDDVDGVTAAISGKLEILQRELSDIVEEGNNKVRSSKPIFLPPHLRIWQQNGME